MVGYRRISSIFPMLPNSVCIWSLVACGAILVTWITRGVLPPAIFDGLVGSLLIRQAFFPTKSFFFN